MDNTRTFNINCRTMTVFIPDAPSNCIVYYNGDTERAADIWKILPEPKPVLAAINGIDWNKDLSPWPAESVFRDADDFAGNADKYLKELTDIIIPELEQSLGMENAVRSIAGYSLAGLFAIYACFKTDMFRTVASMSGSLWFDGFLDFFQTHEFLKNPEYIYFSLGDREKKTRNSRMADVERCTQEIYSLCLERGIKAEFVLNPGGHFNDVTERTARGISSISALFTDIESN